MTRSNPSGLTGAAASFSLSLRERAWVRAAVLMLRYSWRRRPANTQEDRHSCLSSNRVASAPALNATFSPDRQECLSSAVSWTYEPSIARHHQAPARARRRGFTMVELLVVLTIIAMLASVVAATLYVSDQKSREAATKATIAKLHTIVMQIYDSYRTRRVPINTSGMPPKIAAKVRLWALRDIMRMEMPDRRTDIVNLPITFTIPADPPILMSPLTFPPVPPPSVYQAYQPAGAIMTTNTSAECLYLIVTTLGGEDARRQFRDIEVGDTNNNGLMEFLDGWGRPIYFARWAPGFNQSDLQPNVPPTDPLVAAREDHDPFDPRKADPAAWRLVPLIYSGGRDGESGIYPGNTTPLPYVWNNDTYTLAPLIGAPDGTGTHYDNLHNHSVEASLK
jgi:prepilin-type N-terminal cleavage/methylation domain-containing protein